MKKTKLITLSVLLIITSGLLIATVWPSLQRDVNLPKPALVGKYAADSVIEHQRIADELMPKNVTLAEISQILWGMQGITRGSGFRTAPSASAISPLELYVVHGGASDLETGFYKYLPERNGLERISTQAALPGDLGAQLLSNLNTFVIIAGSYDQTVQSYGDRGYLYVDLEIGHIVDNAILQLNALNSITTPVYDFSQSGLQQHFGIAETPFVILPLGNPTTPIQLERVEATGNKSFEEALSRRRSTRDYLEGSIPSADIAELFGPSFNNSFSRDISQKLVFHLVAEHIDGVEPGLYHFTNESSLVLQRSGYLLDDLKGATISGAAIGRGQAALVISMKQTDLALLAEDSFLYRKAIHEIGLITQNFLIKCSELGLGTVTIGGFEPLEVARVLGQTDEIEPVYILPIGITPEYAGDKPGVELTNIGTLLGFAAFALFVLVYFSTLKAIRGYLRKKYGPFHMYLGLISTIFMIMHYLIMHGQAETMLDLFHPVSYINGLVHLFQFGFRMPLGMPDGGHFSANLAILAMSATTIMGILMSLKRVKKKRVLLKIHNSALVLAMLFMIAHIFLNSIVFGSNPNLFLLINAIIFEVYLVIRIASDKRKRRL